MLYVRICGGWCVNVCVVRVCVLCVCVCVCVVAVVVGGAGLILRLTARSIPRKGRRPWDLPHYRMQPPHNKMIPPLCKGRRTRLPF